MLVDGRKKDGKGPYGATRLKIETGDFESSGDELISEDSIEVTVATKKRASQSDLAQMAERAMIGSGGRSVFDPAADDGSDVQEGQESDGLRARFAAATSSLGGAKDANANIQRTCPSCGASVLKKY